MLNGPKYKFACGVASGLSAVEAYTAAYPKSGAEAARRSASKLMTNPDILKEVEGIRKEASGLGAMAVLTVMEKRAYLARIVRARINTLPADSDLWHEYTDKDGMVKRKLPDKLRAIQLDNELAGKGADNDLNITINRVWA